MKFLQCDVCGKLISLNDVYGIATISLSSPFQVEQWDLCYTCREKVLKMLGNKQKAKIYGLADKKEESE